MDVTFTFNGEEVTWEAEPGEVLLDVMRREGYYGAKRGCSTGDCGTCTVMVDGVAVNSCQVFVVSLQGAEVTTVEGLAKRDASTGKVELHPVQREFVDAGGVQCGFCTPGLIISAVALLNEKADPSEAEIREALDGNICRCTGYTKPLEAVARAAKALRESPAPAGA